MDLPRDRLSMEEDPLIMDSEPYLDFDRLYPSSLDKNTLFLSNFLSMHLLHSPAGRPVPLGGQGGDQVVTVVPLLLLELVLELLLKTLETRKMSSFCLREHFIV